MSVQNQTVKNVYAGNGSTTVFPYTFALNEEDGEYVGVYVTNEEGTSELTTNYTINTTAKTVTYPTTGDPLPADRKITILRELPNEQNLNLENLGPFFADDVEDEMDREVMMIQQLAEQVGRAVKVDMTDDLPSASVVYDINHVREYKDDAETAASNSASSATASAASAAEAAASATDAASSATTAGNYKTSVENTVSTFNATLETTVNNAVATATAAAASSANSAANSATAAYNYKTSVENTVASFNATLNEAVAGATATSANYAAQAANKAQAAATSANNAAISEANAAASKNNAASYANSSATSAAAAATSATTAGNAASTVNTALPQVLTAATSAGASATAAQASAAAAALSAGTATTQAEIAANAADDAADSADDAADSAAEAATYAGAAATSATQAESANTEAKYYAKITMDKVAEAAVGYPSQSGTLTYDGTEQTPTWDVFYEPNKMTVTGTTAATNAGTYTITMTPKTGYYWWDTGTTAARTQTWTIGRQAIANVPSQSGAVVYDGTEQSPTWANYDSTKMTIGGTTAATAAGTYTATFTPLSNYKWSDGTTTAKEVAWIIGTMAVTVPTVTNTAKTYNGSAQSPTISTYDSTLISVSGDSATNAGSYAVTFHLLNASTTWTDGTTADKSVAWTIAAKSVTAPTVTNTSKTYTGSAQSPTISAYDSNEITVSGTTSATNAGSYTVTFSLASITNYIWSDSTTAAKSTAWSIAKAAGSLSLSKNSVSLNTSQLTDTISVTRSGDGAISAVSSNTSIATVSVSGTTVTVTAVASGSATVTVSVAAGTNYLAPSSATASVAVQLISNVLDENSWATISQVAQAGTGDTYWDVGDCKEITLNGNVGDYLTLSNQKLCVYILGFNHVDNGVSSENNIYFGGFKSAVSGGTDVALVDSQYITQTTSGTKAFNMNHWFDTSTNDSTNHGGWKGCDLRYDILGATSTPPSGYGAIKTTDNIGYDATDATLTNPVADTLLAALPSDMRAKLRLRTHYVDNKGNSSNVDANVTAVVDAVSLLAEYEIFGSRKEANQYEQNHQAQFAYYAAGNSKVKKKHSGKPDAVFWLGCSSSYIDAHRFFGVRNNGSASGTYASFSMGLAPAFKV